MKNNVNEIDSFKNKIVYVCKLIFNYVTTGVINFVTNIIYFIMRKKKKSSKNKKNTGREANIIDMLTRLGRWTKLHKNKRKLYISFKELAKAIRNPNPPRTLLAWLNNLLAGTVCIVVYIKIIKRSSKSIHNE